MDMKLMIKYLNDLSENNNREWYHAHKAENKAANAEFEDLIQTLILRIGEFDSSILHITRRFAPIFLLRENCLFR